MLDDIENALRVLDARNGKGLRKLGLAFKTVRKIRDEYVLIKISDVPDYAMEQFEDFQIRGEITRHNEDGVEELAIMLGKAIEKHRGKK